MTFKVGDKVRFKSGDYVPTCSNLNNADHCNKYGYDIQKIYEVKTCGDIGFICEGIGWNESGRFELAEQPKPIESQVGDIWANADKSEVVKVVGEYINFGFTRCFTVVYLKGIKKGRGETFDDSNFGKDFPILLQRKPQKQPKPVAETPKKQEEKWEPVIEQGIDSTRCFRKGNSIKWVQNDCEGIATCNKKDKFDLLFGIDLAWHRVQIKRHEAMIAEMLKEGAK